MRKGGRRLLVVPPQLAYGDSARDGIPSKVCIYLFYSEFFILSLLCTYINDPGCRLYMILSEHADL